MLDLELMALDLKACMEVAMLKGPRDNTALVYHRDNFYVAGIQILIVIWSDDAVSDIGIVRVTV